MPPPDEVQPQLALCIMRRGQRVFCACVFRCYVPQVRGLSATVSQCSRFTSPSQHGRARTGAAQPARATARSTLMWKGVKKSNRRGFFFSFFLSFFFTIFEHVGNGPKTTCGRLKISSLTNVGFQINRVACYLHTARSERARPQDP